MNYPVKILPRNLLGPMMQRDVCLEKYKYYPDVHDKQRYDLGVILGHCRAHPAMPVRGISEIHVH